jgi:hypothetical protein
MKVLKVAAPPGWVQSTRSDNFTGRARGNEQTDWLVKLEGARVVYTEEPARGEAGSLDAEWLKELRGDSDVSCRKMYGGEREMRVCFTLYFMANHLPQIAHADEALKKSFVICDLPGKFVDDPAAYKIAKPFTPWQQYIRPVDRELKNTFALPRMRLALMHIVCEQYAAFTQGGSVFKAVPGEFEKWKDEIQLEKDTIGDAFYSAFNAATSRQEVDATQPIGARQILTAVRFADHELKITDQVLGAWMKRAFVDTQHEHVQKKRTKSSMVWTGLVPVQTTVNAWGQ